MKQLPLLKELIKSWIVGIIEVDFMNEREAVMLLFVLLVFIFLIKLRVRRLDGE